ncbi:MAG: exodeoxyribonuclease VII small subunit [Bacillota bacterium]|nr:exodeoxyribonuclease VII small subunit [Bacillota bacterium]
MSEVKDRPAQGGFEASLARLEEVVRRLESGDVPLEEALRLFEEGVTLARTCSERLNDAEKKIEVLIEREDGSFGLRPFSDSAAEADKPSGADREPR